MNADGTLEIGEVRDLYRAAGRSVAEADAVFARAHPGAYWLPPADPTRPSPRPWIAPRRPPPCRRLGATSTHQGAST